MERMNVIRSHLFNGLSQNSNGTADECSMPRPQNNPDDIVVIAARRTPVGKAKRGGFKDTHVEDLLGPVIKAVIDETGVSPSDIGDICVGNVNQPGAGAMRARITQFMIGLPETVPVMAVNRQCSSGLQAFINCAGHIKIGASDIAIAAGVESMSQNAMGSGVDQNALNPKMMEVPKAVQCLMPMGITSENVAERYGISREQQDRMAVDSHRKAHQAIISGKFDAEIVPVTTTVLDKDGNGTSITVSKDEGVRAATTMETLGRLRAVFKDGGTTTAGNSSQLSDGAAAVLLCRRSEAELRGWPVLGVFRGFSVNGVPPDVMGIGPAVAIPEALRKSGLNLSDIDVFEINEAFASQATYCVDKLGIPMEKVNPNGGAIALGHPLGCTGARMIATLLHELKHRGKRGFGVVSMCLGTGMGAAAVFEHPGPQ